MLSVVLQGYLRVVRKSATYIQQFSCRDRCSTRLANDRRSVGNQLQFQISCRYYDSVVFGLDEHVRQDRHCLAAFDYADDGLKGREQILALHRELHGGLPKQSALLSFKA
ncbi:hypothetical protein C84B14_02661 [Salinisphaera sp. C84B14]